MVVECRDLDEGASTDDFGHLRTLHWGDRCEALFGETRESVSVVAKIDLGANQDEGSCRCVMSDLRVPLGTNVLERSGADDGVTKHEDISLRVAEGTKTIVVLLTSSVPKTEVHGFAIDDHVGIVIIEDGRNVLFRECICSKGD